MNVGSARLSDSRAKSAVSLQVFCLLAFALLTVGSINAYYTRPLFPYFK